MVSKCSALVFLACISASMSGRVRRDDGYGPPEPSYSEPSYSEPDAYGPPEPSYGAPEAYSAPAPSYGATEAGGLDLTTLIIPLLALVGLFLLFPTYVTLTSVRRKREAGEESEDISMVERIQDMYMAVVESEECMERVACEVGGMARDAGLDNTIASTAALMVPTKYSKFAKQFASPKNCQKIKCGSF
jgi:hypothetical protein